MPGRLSVGSVHTNRRKWAKGLLLAAALVALPDPLMAAEGAAHAPSEVVFLLQIILLLVAGRLHGEGMQRIGQPAIMGQLIAGMLLGPSVFGALWPDLQHMVFPRTPEQKAMIDAVSQLGILMLLLLTGMETDLSLVRRTGRTALSVSLAGISVPFLCGILVGELLPDSMLPHPDHRLITTLFLGIALAISSVKIAAVTIRDLNFLRRTLGQLIVTAAIIDDTIGWILLSIILGLGASGQIELSSVAQSVFGTLLFLVASFTLGRRLVARLTRGTKEIWVSDVPLIPATLVVGGVRALIPDAMGFHPFLGPFGGEMLGGQPPTLPRHIDEQL